MRKYISLLLLLATCSLHAAPATLTVLLDWLPNPDHAPLIVAKEKGFFKAEGLDVKLITPADPNDPPKQVAAGNADIAITYQPEFMEQVDQGLPLTRIGTLMDKPLDCIVALKSSGIKTIADLKGKRIGSGSSGVGNVLLRVMLKNAGINGNDVEVINLRYNLSQALMSKKVDAITGVMRNVEVPELEMKKQQLVTFYPEDYGVPNYNVLIFVSNTSKIRDPRFPHFLNAIRKAVAYLDAHPSDAWTSFAKAYPEANNKINREIWFNTLPYFAEDPSILNEDEWKKFALFMRDNKMIKTVQPMSRYAVSVEPEIIS